ncbi:hypothetical protein NLI96_g8005 [Meripilus lineatus]|uniref:AB hydrolase-1 domain-containing protein n=1 Tax=Meripilus lineatus TaxID=2056292 RepID=A0AAD5UYC3_9APHY|nr:hypothetical protein NLI96_g8005 [Physisporinus lineatus]
MPWTGAGVPLTSPQMYSAGFTDDIRVALMWISKMYPHAPLLGVGFSLGANVLTRYLAQEGDQSRLAAGCVLGCPWDLTANSDRLESGPILRIYSRGMAQNLSRVMARHSEALENFQTPELKDAMTALQALKNPSLRDFDNAVTRVVGGSSPPFPFETAHHYYAWGSSHKLLCDVKVPLLALNADDDPIVRVLPIDDGPDALGPYVAFGVTRGGGHLGWFEQGSYWGHSKRWVAKPVVEWLRAMGNEMVHPRRNSKKLIEVDDFLKEEGGANIGCKVVEGGGHIIGIEGEEGLLAGL